MKKKIFWSIFISSLLAVLITGGLVLAVVYSIFVENHWSVMQQEGEYLSRGIEQAQDVAAYLKQVASEDTRITLISPIGLVIYDDIASVEGLENHLHREEVQQALSNGVGKSSRYSATLGEMTFYYAVRLSDGSILRISSTQRSAMGVLYHFVIAMAVILACIGIISGFFARRMAKQITEPINGLNLEKPLLNYCYDELSPLLLRMDEQNRSIREHVKRIEAHQQQFAEITGHMREGLVLMDASAHVLSINQSACNLLDVHPDNCMSQHILSLNHSEELHQVIDLALKGETADNLLHWRERWYQLFGNPVLDGNGQLTGVALLVLDVTERQDAEKLRREFSANVSHELKTPLTSIQGYAEIMKAGLAQQEDMPVFAGRIYDEARRIIALVEDIMKLSRLDEGNMLPEKETVDLLQVAEAVVNRLNGFAQQQNIALSVSGIPLTVSVIRSVLEEMLYNIIDNAIKYNRPQGSVEVSVSKIASDAVLTVKDTGIGISMEHQNKIFERFYRVDKSHSRQTGGTGLGLSIVKHGAQLNNARIELKSVVDAGTSVVLYFPIF